jgi:hypothetical protein
MFPVFFKYFATRNVIVINHTILFKYLQKLQNLFHWFIDAAIFGDDDDYFIRYIRLLYFGL